MAEIQPQFIKLDMKLIRDIHKERVKQSILRGILATAQDLGIKIIAEGIEQAEEVAWFRDHGVKLMQGYLFARPAFEHVFHDSEISYPDL